MADAGFFRGTNTDQDSRFRDKQKTLLKQMKFNDNLTTKVDIKKVNIDVLKPWITNRVNEILGIEDDVVIEFIFNQLEERHPDPKLMQINLTGFLNAKKSREFMGELWQHLIDAQTSPDGIPPALIELKKEELRKKQKIDEELKETLRKREEKIREEAKDWKQEEPDSYSDRRNRNRHRDARSRSPNGRRDSTNTELKSSPRSKATEDELVSSTTAVSKLVADSAVSSTSERKLDEADRDTTAGRKAKRTPERAVSGKRYRKRSVSRSPQTRRSRSNELIKRRRSRSNSRSRYQQRMSPPRRQRFSPPAFRRRPGGFNSRRRSPAERRRSPRRRVSHTPSPPSRSLKPSQNRAALQEVLKRRSPSKSSVSSPERSPPRVQRREKTSESVSSRDSRSPPATVSNGSTVARNRRKGEKFTDGSQLLASLKTNGEGYKSIEDSMSTSDATKSRRQQSEEKHMDKGNSTRRVRSSSPGSGSPTAKRGPAAKKGYDLSNRDKRNGQEKVSRRGGQSSESDNENSRKRKSSPTRMTDKKLKSYQYVDEKSIKDLERSMDKKKSPDKLDYQKLIFVEKCEDKLKNSRASASPSITISKQLITVEESERKKKKRKHHKKHKKHKKSKKEPSAKKSDSETAEYTISAKRGEEVEELRAKALQTLKRDNQQSSEDDSS